MIPVVDVEARPFSGKADRYGNGRAGRQAAACLGLDNEHGDASGRWGNHARATARCFNHRDMHDSYGLLADRGGRRRVGARNDPDTSGDASGCAARDRINLHQHIGGKAPWIYRKDRQVLSLMPNSEKSDRMSTVPTSHPVLPYL